MIIERDVAIPASDGLVLRADIFRPATSSSSTPCPVLMSLGPYGKGVSYETGYSLQYTWLTTQHPSLLPGSTRSHLTWETVDPELWTSRWNYAVIRVDSRGTGRTPGSIDLLSSREILDFYDAIEWAGVQPWSTGRVGLIGISYYAMNQWRVAQLQPPHLAAMVPWEGCADSYREWLRHGGIASNGFFEAWYERQVLKCQHGNPDGWADEWLKGEKSTGPDVLSEEDRRAKRTDMLAEVLDRELEDEWYRERSVVDYSKITVPFLSAANWGGTGLHGRGNFEAFTRAASENKWLEIHPGRHDEAFYLDDAMALQKRFLDYFLKNEENGWQTTPRVIMHQRRPGEPYSGVRHEQAWPLPDTQWTKMYLSASDSSLRPATASPSPSPSPSENNSSDEISFHAPSTSLTFLSAPLARETELTGPFAAHLSISSSTADADLFLTLQAFAPNDGAEVTFQGGWDPATPLSQGWLRASHRKLDPELSTPERPYHSHDEVRPLVPGEVTELDVEVWPTHVILPEGYRIGLRIEGRDFEREVVDGGREGGMQLTGGGRGSGPFRHDHPRDRGSEVFRGTTTIHTGGECGSYLLMPVIPARE